MLKNKFWTGLRILDLKNATRFRYLKDKFSFEPLRTRVRATAYENHYRSERKPNRQR